MSAPEPGTQQFSQDGNAHPDGAAPPATNTGGPVFPTVHVGGPTALVKEVPEPDISPERKNALLNEMEMEFNSRGLLKLINVDSTLSEAAIKADLNQFGEVRHLEYPDVTRKDLVVVAFPTKSEANRCKQELKAINGKPVIVEDHKSESTLFVGNLVPTVTSSDIKTLFRVHGVIERAFVVRSMNTGKSKSYALVEFRTKLEAIRAKNAMSSAPFQGRQLRVDWADISTFESIQSNVLFVDQLPRDFADEATFRQTWERFGPVTQALIATFPYNGAPRGHGFVVFQSSDAAERAQAEMNGSDFRGHRIRISFGVPNTAVHLTRGKLVEPPVPGSAPVMGRGRGFGRGRGGFGRGGFGGPYGGPYGGPPAWGAPYGQPYSPYPPAYPAPYQAPYASPYAGGRGRGAYGRGAAPDAAAPPGVSGATSYSKIPGQPVLTNATYANAQQAGRGSYYGQAQPAAAYGSTYQSPTAGGFAGYADGTPAGATDTYYQDPQAASAGYAQQYATATQQAQYASYYGGAQGYQPPAAPAQPGYAAGGYGAPAAAAPGYDGAKRPKYGQF
jgi:hypothetical protein